MRRINFSGITQRVVDFLDAQPEALEGKEMVGVLMEALTVIGARDNKPQEWLALFVADGLLRYPGYGQPLLTEAEFLQAFDDTAELRQTLSDAQLASLQGLAQN